MFSLLFKSESKRIEELEQRVRELEEGMAISIRLMKAQSEALVSLTAEVVKISEVLKEVISDGPPRSRKPKSQDYFH